MRYFDHDGIPTEDPSCELGFCFECIDHWLGIGQVPVIPALSTHDPRFFSDIIYQKRVMEALEVWRTQS